MNNISISLGFDKLKCLICKQNNLSIKAENYHHDIINLYLNCSCNNSTICFKLNYTLEKINVEFESVFLIVYNYNGDKYSVFQYKYDCSIEHSPKEPWIRIPGIIFDIHNHDINVLEKVKNCINFS
jgi:hypothetical protein